VDLFSDGENGGNPPFGGQLEALMLIYRFLVHVYSNYVMSYECVSLFTISGSLAMHHDS